MSRQDALEAGFQPRFTAAWRESQRRWRVVQANHPRRSWLLLVSEHYDYLYPKP